MNAGWIKLHREIQNHWIWQDDRYFKWWMIILLNVNHEARNFPVGTELFVCNQGQSFRSIQQWTDLFLCSKKTTIKFFSMLENDNMIQSEIIGKGNRRKHLLTVVNWGKLQGLETENYTERKPKITPKGNPNVPPNKNDKNDKNNLSVIFEEFRKAYPGKKRGFEPEFENFKKKQNGKHEETVKLLMPALQKEIANHEQLSKAEKFVPEWKNLQTWINQQCWTQEFPESNNSVKPQIKESVNPDYQ